MGITSGIREWYWNPMVLNRIQNNKPSSLESELEGAYLVEEELGKKRAPWTKTMAQEGEDHTKEKMEYIQIIRPLFEEMNKNILFMSQQIKNDSN